MILLRVDTANDKRVTFDEEGLEVLLIISCYVNRISEATNEPPSLFNLLDWTLPSPVVVFR